MRKRGRCAPAQQHAPHPPLPPFARPAALRPPLMVTRDLVRHAAFRDLNDTAALLSVHTPFGRHFRDGVARHFLFQHVLFWHVTLKPAASTFPRNLLLFCLFT